MTDTTPTDPAWDPAFDGVTEDMKRAAAKREAALRADRGETDEPPAEAEPKAKRGKTTRG